MFATSRPVSGRDLLAILCLYVHMYDHHIGDQRGQNRGRTMLEKIEAEARAAGWKGIVAWGMDWEIWNPVSFYERMNYCRADQEGKVVAVWKPFCDDAKAPSLMRLDSELPGAADDKVSVLVADNAWCSSFVGRMESDIKTRKFAAYLCTYLNELWSINDHYYEFVQQFYEIAENIETPRETADQYTKFVVEYNAFAQNFRDTITELKNVARTEVEPPSVKFARELPGIR